MSYDKNSIQAQLGDGFRDFVQEELNKRGCQFQTTHSKLGHLPDYPKYDQLIGDIFDEGLEVFIECKAAFNTHTDNVSIGENTRNNFVGNKRYYAVGRAVGNSYTDVKFFEADSVKSHMISVEGEKFYRVREVEEDGGKIKRYQLFGHFQIPPFAVGFDEFVAKIKGL